MTGRDFTYYLASLANTILSSSSVRGLMVEKKKMRESDPITSNPGNGMRKREEEEEHMDILFGPN